MTLAEAGNVSWDAIALGPPSFDCVAANNYYGASSAQVPGSPYINTHTDTDTDTDTDTKRETHTHNATQCTCTCAPRWVW